MKLKTKFLSAVIAGIMTAAAFVGVLPRIVPDTGNEMTVSAAASDHTADDAIEWVSAQVGKALNPDGAYGAQCVDLIDAYFEYLGYNWRNYLVDIAKDFSWKSCPEDWSRIKGATPQKGDVLVYTNGTYGHVAICESENVHYDQNVWNNSTGVYEQWVHKIYTSCTGSGYWGVLRPNFNNNYPSKPTLTVNAGTDNSDTVFSWNKCSKADQYDVRIWDSNDDNYHTEFGITGTSFKITLPKGSYTANVAAVNGPDYVWTFSDTVSFTVSGHFMDEKDAAGQTIPDGDYIICTELNQNYYLDIPGTDKDVSNGTNICISKATAFTFDDYDLWTVTYQKDGFYRIKQKSSDSYLDGWGHNTNAHMWHNPGGTNSEWSIKATDHGYEIQARSSGCYLDVQGGKVENGTKVLVYNGNNSSTNQSWCFIPADPEPEISDGLYKIRSAVHSEYALNAAGKSGYKEGTNIQIWDDTDNDIFKVTHDKKGYYYISEVTSGLVVGLGSTGKNWLKLEENVALYTKNDKRNLKWAFLPMSRGSYCIVNEMNGYCLDIYNSGSKSYENGRNVDQWRFYGEPIQQWTLEPVEPLAISVSKMPDKTSYSVDEELNIAGIKVTIDYSGEYSEDITDKVTYNYDFSETGEKNVTVRYKDSDSTFTTKYSVTVKGNGDVNKDKKFNTSDAVLLKKHLLGIKALTVNAPENADLNGDGKVNVFDLIMMKRLLLSK